MNAMSANASHPQMAFLRCWALQRPARAASDGLALLLARMPISSRLVSDMAPASQPQDRAARGVAGVHEGGPAAPRGSDCPRGGVAGTYGFGWGLGRQSLPWARPC